MLLWSSLLHCLGFYFLIINLIEYRSSFNIYNSLRDSFIVLLSSKVVTLLLYPVAGLLAETLLTRYKVMMIGTVIAVIGLVLVLLSTISGTVLIYKRGGFSFDPSIYIPVIPGFIIYHFGLGLFEANAIQFGTDQLQFGSNEELSKFVHWYFWTLFSVQYTLSSILPFLTFVNFKYIAWIWNLQAVIALACSVFAVIIIFRLHDHLFTEPVGHTNPVKQIIEVISYSRQHKQPVRRSAFTYGEPPPSRLDLGKERYGGPFTTEQVEDVKSFGRIFILMLSLFGLSLLLGSNGQMGDIYDDYYNGNGSKIFPFVAVKMGDSYAIYYVIIIGIPVYMCLLRPCLRHHLPNMLKKIGIGLLMIIVAFVLTTIYMALMHMTYINRGIECFSNMSSQISIHTTHGLGEYAAFLFIIAQLFSGLGYLLVFLTALEFILAQAPRSMQGLLIGLWYAYQSLAVVVRLVSVLTLQDVHCHYWPYIVKTVLAIVSLLLYLLVSHWYKYRQREEPSNINRQAIIEEYTERQLTRKNTVYVVENNEFNSDQFSD